MSYDWIADTKNVKKMIGLSDRVSKNATADPTQIGIIATLYMGGLIAAYHNFFLVDSIDRGVIQLAPNN